MTRPRFLTLPAASGLLTNLSGVLLLHATLETTGTSPAGYNLYDGDGAGGQLMLPIALSAGESTRDVFPRHLLPFYQGLYYDLTSGAVEGVVVVQVGEWDELEAEYWALAQAGL